MKLCIDLQDYKELENIVERRNKRNLYKLFDNLITLLMIMSGLSMLLSFCLLFAFESFKYPTIALISGVSFCLLGIIMDMKHDNCNIALKKSLLIRDLKSPMKILNYDTSNNADGITNQFYFEYFDDNDILQSKKFYFDKIYTHKKDYYKIVGQFDNDRKNYRFYLYKPYLPLCVSDSDSVNKDITHAKNVTININ